MRERATGKNPTWIVTLVCAAVGLHAQDAPRIEIGADPTRITVGDLVDYKVTVTGARGSSVEFPTPAEALGPFEVRTFRVLDPMTESGGTVFGAEWKLSIFETGEFRVPSIEVVYTPPDGGPPKTLSTPETSIVVESVKTGDASDIRDIKPPLEIPRAWWTYWPWAALLAGLAILVFGLSRRGRAKPGPEPIRPRLSPYAEAYQALCRLRDGGLPDAAGIKPYYTELSEVMRRYLQRRYAIHALEMTSAEIGWALGRLEVGESARELFDRLFGRCDLVKFAKHVPTPGHTQASLDMAFQLLEETRPEEPVVTVDKPLAAEIPN